MEIIGMLVVVENQTIKIMLRQLKTLDQEKEKVMMNLSKLLI